MHKQRLIIIVVAAVGLISVFLPWASAEGWGESETINGLNTLNNGLFALISFIAAGALAFLGDKNESVSSDSKFKWGVVAAGALATVIALIDLINIATTDASAIGIDYSPSFGVFLALIAGAAVAAVAFLLGDNKSAGESS